MGVNQMWGIAGGFVGLILGGLLASIDWRLVFLISVPSRLVNYGPFGRRRVDERGVQCGLAAEVVRVPRLGAGSCCRGSRDESRHADEVVRGRHQICRQLRQVQPDESRSAEATDSFHPAKDLLHSFAFPLTDGITRMMRGAPIDRTASPFRVLSHMWRDVASAQVSHTLPRVIALVAGQRSWTKTSLTRLIDEVGHNVAFGRAARLADLEVD
jgi:hypothetical protein